MLLSATTADAIIESSNVIFKAYDGDKSVQMAPIMSEPVVAFSVELLLDTIKQHPVLYDKTNPRYKEAECKEEIWKKIAQDTWA
ncbi:hypothetical protein HPB52_000905 [Rhipicephalus sanguineus]|uniref:MADF domain-containing protein n=1 Tax=Rhipicephalus sanguineus TaxID=34632 RepID=A0A9D4PTH5_RHISA|nr:hypothetical protein HPB52_000905 [Rhipicephalus sanguineus]